MRMTFVCRSAIRLPTVIVSAASVQNSGCQTLLWFQNAMYTRFSSATKPAAFDATDRNAVIGVGAPSYVSGAHVWNGTADTLNANPTTQKTMPRVTIGRVLSASDAPTLANTVSPVAP